MLHKGEILTIQRFIYLLDDFHYGEFTAHLSAVNAALPLKLAETIRKKLPEFDTHENLCKKIYGSISQKQNFNQLASYTFKLSGNLSNNYPDYLHHNVSKVERLINECKTEEANFLADNLLDISARIEDFSTQAFTLRFLTQQAFLLRDAATGFRLDKELETLLETKAIFSKVVNSLRRTLYDSSLLKKADVLKQLKLFYKQYHKHDSSAVRIISQYAYLYTVYYFNPQMFDDKDDIALIERLQKDLNNYCYVVFPFLFDIKGIFGFLTMNSSLVQLGTTEGKKYFQELNAHYSSIKFWKNYLNMPQIFSIAVQATRFVSSYHFLVHRADYHRLLPAKDLKIMNSLLESCAEIISNNLWEKNYKNDLISVRMLYGALLVLSGGTNVKKGIDELESVLITYQQINMSGSTDSIFLALMIGYFSTKQYEKCSDTFKRYQKVIRGKPVYEGNDISIHTYYYLSRWFFTHHVQYLNKLQTNYNRTLNAGGPRNAIEELVRYFKLEVELN